MRTPAPEFCPSELTPLTFSWSGASRGCATATVRSRAVVQAANLPARPMPKRGSYGVDAPYVPFMLGAIGGVLTVLGIVLIATVGFAWGVFPLIAGVWMLLSTASYMYTTMPGKFDVWSELLSDLHLRGDERVLDTGTGRGAVLLQAAQHLPPGHAVGLDLWKTTDQTGNSPEATTRNAQLEDVADRIELHTGDMQAMPFPDDSFDVVLSSLAIHNIPDPVGREKAIDEAVRVLKPGGRLLIADIQNAEAYADRLGQLGLSNLRQRNLGPRFWYGGPWMATRLVSTERLARRHAAASQQYIGRGPPV